MPILKLVNKTKHVVCITTVNTGQNWRAGPTRRRADAPTFRPLPVTNRTRPLYSYTSGSHCWRLARSVPLRPTCKVAYALNYHNTTLTLVSLSYKLALSHCIERPGRSSPSYYSHLHLTYSAERLTYSEQPPDLFAYSETGL